MNQKILGNFKVIYSLEDLAEIDTIDLNFADKGYIEKSFKEAQAKIFKVLQYNFNINKPDNIPEEWALAKFIAKTDYIPIIYITMNGLSIMSCRYELQSKDVFIDFDKKLPTKCPLLNKTIFKEKLKSISIQSIDIHLKSGDTIKETINILSRRYNKFYSILIEQFLKKFDDISVIGKILNEEFKLRSTLDEEGKSSIDNVNIIIKDEDGLLVDKLISIQNFEPIINTHFHKKLPKSWG